MQEIWKDVKGYEGLYKACNLIKVMNVRTGKILKPAKASNGYLTVALCKNGVQKTHTIHRIIAEAFIPNPDNKPCIDHINTDRTDNRIENLRWVTYKEQMENELTKEHCKEAHKTETDNWFKCGNKNLMYGKTGEKCPTSKPVLQYDLDGNFIKEWECMREVERVLGIQQSKISLCCQGKRNKTGGYRWAYKT